jgi:putative transposase
MQFVRQYAGSIEEACKYLTQAYATGELPDELKAAIDNSNDKLNSERRGHVSPRTVKRWKSLFNQKGSCMPQKTRIETLWASVWWLPMFLACYRKPQAPKLKESHREFEKDWAAHGFSAEECPSYDTVRRVIEKVPPLIKETGRATGSKLAAMKPFVRRDWSGASNEVWVGDGHTFKAKVRHPEHGYAFAPEVTVIIDAASRFIVGWAFSLSENQIAVAEALGNAMSRYGKPLIYYSDNGKGQTAKIIDCPYGGMLARLGVQHETGRPGNPQGRGIIEGMWDITTIAVAKTLPTFQGTGMDPDTLKKRTREIDKAKRKGGVPNWVIGWEDFMELCVQRFHWYNTQHQHRSLGGKKPAEVYLNNVEAEWHCPLTEAERLSLYRPSRERTVARGEVRWNNNIYFAPELKSLPENTKVRMAFDLNNAEKVWISDLEGRFICEALWNANKKDGFEKSYRESLKDDRVRGMKKRAQDKIDLADMEGRTFDGELAHIPANELPNMRVTAQKVEEKRVAAEEETLPRHTDPRDRHQYWLDLDQRVKAGEAFTETLLNFHKGYANSRDYAVWSAYFNNLKQEPDEGSNQTGTL